MKNTTERTITDITNIVPFRSLAHEPEYCVHTNHTPQTEATTTILTALPELETLIDNFLLNYLQNAFVTVYTPNNNSIVRPEPQYPSFNHDSDNYSSCSDLDNNESSQSEEEDRLQTWLSKVEQPSRARAIHFANTDHLDLPGKTKKKIYSSYRLKKKHNK